MNKAFVDTNVFLRILVRDDEHKSKSSAAFIENSKANGLIIYVLPVTVMELVWVLEKLYKLERGRVREMVEAILNTPQLEIENEEVFRKALALYEKSNLKFADALLGFWGMNAGCETVITFDRKHFEKIEGLKVIAP